MSSKRNSLESFMNIVLATNGGIKKTQREAIEKLQLQIDDFFKNVCSDISFDPVIENLDDDIDNTLLEYLQEAKKYLKDNPSDRVCDLEKLYRKALCRHLAQRLVKFDRKLHEDVRRANPEDFSSEDEKDSEEDTSQEEPKKKPKEEDGSKSVEKKKKPGRPPGSKNRPKQVSDT